MDGETLYLQNTNTVVPLSRDHPKSNFFFKTVSQKRWSSNRGKFITIDTSCMKKEVVSQKRDYCIQIDLSSKCD